MAAGRTRLSPTVPTYGQALIFAIFSLSGRLWPGGWDVSPGILSIESCLNLKCAVCATALATGATIIMMASGEQLHIFSKYIVLNFASDMRHGILSGRVLSSLAQAQSVVTISYCTRHGRVA